MESSCDQADHQWSFWEGRKNMVPLQDSGKQLLEVDYFVAEVQQARRNSSGTELIFSISLSWQSWVLSAQILLVCLEIDVQVSVWTKGQLYASSFQPSPLSCIQCESNYGTYSLPKPYLE